MARFSSIVLQFNESTGNLSRVWRDESIGWQDKKSEEFGRNVINPIAKECIITSRLLKEMDHVLNLLIDNDLIDEK